MRSKVLFTAVLAGLTVGILSPILTGRALAVGLGATDWPMVGHDAQHTARSPYSGPLADYAKWTVDGAANSEGSPTIGSDGTVYFGTDASDPNNPDKLRAVNPDGSIKWAVTLSTGNNIATAPAIGDDGTIYVAVHGVKLEAFNPNGTLKWVFDPASPSGAYSSPVIAPDGTIYFADTSGNVFAVNPNGTEQWRRSVGNFVYSSPALAQDGTIYITNTNRTLFAINPDGTQKWAYPLQSSTQSGINYASPSVGADGTIYIGTGSQFTAFAYMNAINPNGTSKWVFTVPEANNDIRSTAAIGADGAIYFTTSGAEGKLYVLNSDGSVRWSYNNLLSVASPIVDASGTVYVASANPTPPYNATYAISATGTYLWSHQHGADSMGTPALAADGTLYVLDGAGILTAFSKTPVPDHTPPQVTGEASGTPTRQGWYNTNQTITWTSVDPSPSSGTPTQPPVTIASTEGTHTYTSAPSCDPAGNCATGSLTLKIDKTKPMANSLTSSTFLPTHGVPFTLTATGSDSLSGIGGGEYFIDTDPGVGNGTRMNASGNTAVASVNTQQTGLHLIGARLKDNANNWSSSTVYTIVWVL
jgi:outer membrane protein assembly factor BamB